MKRTIPFLLIVILMLTITIYITNIEKHDFKAEIKQLKEENTEYKTELEHYKEQISQVEKQYGRVVITNIYDISFREYRNKIGKESFIIIFTMGGCSHCETFIPKIDEILFNLNIKAYKIDIADLSENEFNQVLKETELNSTPTTYIYKAGTNIKEELKGDKTASEIEKFIKENYYEE